MLAAIARDLHVAVVRPRPDDLPVLGRLGDRINRRVHLGHGVIHRDAAGFFLLLLFRIVSGQIGRDALPGLAVIARAEHELRADVDGALLIRTEHQRRVPIEAQLRLAVPRVRLNGARFVRDTVHPLDFPALRLHIDVSRVGGIFPHPEAVAAAHVLPARIAHAAGIGRIAHPATVVLQTAVHAIRLGIIRADVIELRDRQVHQMLPARAAVLAAPQAAIVSGEHHVGDLPGSIHTS